MSLRRRPFETSGYNSTFSPFDDLFKNTKIVRVRIVLCVYEKWLLIFYGFNFDNLNFHWQFHFSVVNIIVK